MPSSAAEVCFGRLWCDGCFFTDAGAGLAEAGLSWSSFEGFLVSPCLGAKFVRLGFLDTSLVDGASDWRLDDVAAGVAPFWPDEAVWVVRDAGSFTGLVGDFGLGLWNALGGGDRDSALVDGSSDCRPDGTPAGFAPFVPDEAVWAVRDAGSFTGIVGDFGLGLWNALGGDTSVELVRLGDRDTDLVVESAAGVAPFWPDEAVWVVRDAGSLTGIVGDFGLGLWNALGGDITVAFLSAVSVGASDCRLAGTPAGFAPFVPDEAVCVVRDAGSFTGIVGDFGLGLWNALGGETSAVFFSEVLAAVGVGAPAGVVPFEPDEAVWVVKDAGSFTGLVGDFGLGLWNAPEGETTAAFFSAVPAAVGYVPAGLGVRLDAVAEPSEALLDFFSSAFVCAAGCRWAPCLVAVPLMDLSVVVDVPPGVVFVVVFEVEGEFVDFEESFVDCDGAGVVTGSCFVGRPAGAALALVANGLSFPSVVPSKVSPNPPILFSAPPPLTAALLVGSPGSSFAFLSSTDVFLSGFALGFDSFGAALRLPACPFI
jgi:hypothetical protein